MKRLLDRALATATGGPDTEVTTLQSQLEGYPNQGCEQDTSDVRMVGVAQHPNGLIMAIPEGFEAQQQAIGFMATEKGSLRNPQTFTLQMQRSDTKSSLVRRFLNLFKVQEQISILDGTGSSGDDYRLEASRTLGACQLILKASMRSANGEPSFHEARVALMRALVTRVANCAP
jgi:hypothetical protein